MQQEKWWKAKKNQSKDGKAKTHCHIMNAPKRGMASVRHGCIDFFWRSLLGTGIRQHPFSLTQIMLQDQHQPRDRGTGVKSAPNHIFRPRHKGHHDIPQ
jgi:hypothetical protein